MVAAHVADSYGLGTMLYLPYVNIEEIRDKNNDLITVNTKMMIEWIRTESRAPTTWATLVNVLKEIDEIALSKKILAQLEERARARCS